MRRTKSILDIWVVLLNTAFAFVACGKLPYAYNKDAIDNMSLEDHIVIRNNFNKEILVHAITSGPMAFSSSINYIGLYSESGYLIEQINIGNTAPFRLMKWDQKEIIIDIVEKNHREINERWLKGKNRLGDYKLTFLY